MKIRRAFADLPVGQIHYAECGEWQAKTVLLLHQTPRSWDEYRDVLPVLGRHFRAIAMDTIGFGDSTKPALGQDSIEHWAKTAIGLADALGSRFTHIGFARRDIHLGSVGHKARGDHLADAAGAAGDQGDFACDREQLVEVSVHGFFPKVSQA